MCSQQPMYQLPTNISKKWRQMTKDNWFLKWSWTTWGSAKQDKIVLRPLRLLSSFSSSLIRGCLCGPCHGGWGRGGKMTRYDIHTWKSEQKLGGLWNYSSLFQYLHWWMKMLTPMILDNSAPKNSRSEEDFLYCLYHLQYQKPIYIMISVSNVLEKVLLIVFFG